LPFYSFTVFAKFLNAFKTQNNGKVHKCPNLSSVNYRATHYPEAQKLVQVMESNPAFTCRCSEIYGSDIANTPGSFSLSHVSYHMLMLLQSCPACFSTHADS
jgi:hypothetical protein